jgi:hypothetical protein
VFFFNRGKNDRRPLKERMIEQEKRWLSYHHSTEDREVIKAFIRRLDKMDRVDPPFVLESARFQFLKNSEGEYMVWGLNFREDGFVTKGIRLRDKSQLSSQVIKEIPFPEDIWDFDTHHELKNDFGRLFAFKIIPGKETRWKQSNIFFTTFPSINFDNQIYVTLYDSQGKECEPILCERIRELIGKHHTAELTEPNVKLWTGNLEDK